MISSGVYANQSVSQPVWVGAHGSAVIVEKLMKILRRQSSEGSPLYFAALLAYKNRLIYGAQWRADIITAIERGAKTPTEISRMCGASYESCHRVLSELKDAGIFEGPGKRMRRVVYPASLSCLSLEKTTSLPRNRSLH